uniref:Uncharacterized protein n=1 Tax=Zea mays TaxID=4577 RepID=A0A804R0J5_MAIZE
MVVEAVLPVLAGGLPIDAKGCVAWRSGCLAVAGRRRINVRFAASRRRDEPPEPIDLCVGGVDHSLFCPLLALCGIIVMPPVGIHQRIHRHVRTVPIDASLPCSVQVSTLVFMDFQLL